MIESPFYIQHLSEYVNSYELKKFRVQYDEVQLVKYLVKKAKTHEKDNMNKTYLVRDKTNENLVAFFCLKAATLPYNDIGEPFLIPAIELTHFAVDERYRSQKDAEMKTGEFIFWNHIIPEVRKASEYIACKDLYIFSLKVQKLINYYKNRLNFKELQNIDDKQFFTYAVQNYDDDCKFLYYPL